LHNYFLALSCCVGLPLISYAQTHPGENIVVTATRIPGVVSADDPNVTVIDASDIAKHHFASVVELLQTLPGVAVQQAGGRGSVVSVFTRGAKPNFTLVLIDGVEVNDDTNTRGGSFDFSTLALDDIERVEIVRGPASAIYGSDAVGAVINFITRGANHRSEGNLDASTGSQGFKRAAGVLGGSGVRVGASYTDNGTPVPGSLFHGSNVYGAAADSLTDNVSLSLTARYSAARAQSFPDSSGGPLLAVLRQVERRDVDESIVAGHLRYAFASNWGAALDYGLYDRTSSDVSPGVAPSLQTPSGIPASTDDVRFVRNSMTATVTYKSLQGLEAASGIALQSESGRDTGMLDFGAFGLPTSFSLNRYTAAEYVQLRDLLTQELQLSGGARYDKTGGQESHFSPNAGLEYDLARTGTRLTMSWGQAFKLPSFYALGNPIVGDKTLRPETATNVSAGLSQSLVDTRIRMKIDGYDTHYGDLIDFKPGAVPKLVNLSNARARGGELSIELHATDRLDVTPTLSYTDAFDESSGAALRDVPRVLVGGTARWMPSPAITIAASFQRVGALTDNSIPTGDVRLPAHQCADVSASWRMAASLMLYASGDNIFNAHYQDVVGFPAPGAALRAGVTLSY
jgi:vitamin B12 transporter